MGLAGIKGRLERDAAFAQDRHAQRLPALCSQLAASRSMGACHMPEVRRLVGQLGELGNLPPEQCSSGARAWADTATRQLERLEHRLGVPVDACPSGSAVHP